MRTAASGLLAMSCLVLTSCASSRAPTIPAYLNQPLDAGLTREYQRDYATVVQVVRFVVGRRTVKVVEEPGSRATIVYDGSTQPSMYGLGRPPHMRPIVVQELATDRVAVRVLLPPESGGQSEAAGSAYRTEMFNRIEWKLSQQ